MIGNAVARLGRKRSCGHHRPASSQARQVYEVQSFAAAKLP
jgi:hypothetical protein